MKNQDKAAGLKEGRIGGALVPGYDGEVAMKVMEAIAEGKTLVEVSKMQGMPSRATIYRWLAAYPDLAKAYEVAREISAQSFEEEALDMARTLKGDNDFTGVKVRMYEAAMGQFRWSAARRDPKRYGAKTEAALVVPIQINTTLDMGSGSGDRMPVTSDAGDNIYSITASVEGPDDIAEMVDEAFNLPEDPKHTLPLKPMGRPTIASKKHKTARGISATITAHSQRGKTRPKKAEKINGSNI